MTSTLGVIFEDFYMCVSLTYKDKIQDNYSIFNEFLMNYTQIVSFKFQENDQRLSSERVNVSNLSPIESEKLKKLAPAPTIPIDQLKAQIASFRHININNDKKQSWIIVGNGSGYGILLLVVICGCLYWRCKNHQSKIQITCPCHLY